MKLKIRITTIKGRARKTEKRIRPFILGVRKPKSHKVRFNKADNQIIWELEDDVRKMMKVKMNVLRFDMIIEKIFSNKLLMKKVKPDQVKELEDMLKNHTKVEIVEQ